MSIEMLLGTTGKKSIVFFTRTKKWVINHHIMNKPDQCLNNIG